MLLLFLYNKKSVCVEEKNIMEKTKQLSIFDKELLTNEEQEFILLHQKIVQSGVNLAISSYEFARNLKAMKDKALYSDAGFASFDEYVETVLKLKKSQVYNYITIAEKYSPDFFQSIGKDLGMTKLLALTVLDETEIKDFVTENDVDSLTVRQLKEQLAQLMEEKEKLALQNVELTEECNQLSLNLIYDDNENEQTVVSFEDKLKESSSDSKKDVSKDKLVVEETAEYLELKKQLAKNIDVKNQLETKLNDAISVAIEKEKAVVELAKTKEELESLKKKSMLVINENFNKFSLLFDLLKDHLKNINTFILGLDDVEFVSKCRKALNALLSEVISND